MRGLYTVFAARKVGPTGYVFALEPSRREAASLGRNSDLNRLTNVRCLQLAAGAASGTANLSVADSEFDGHNSLAGLALARTFPNLRYTIDGEDFRWTSFTGRTTQVALGQATQLEILIYSEAPFDFVLDDIELAPEGIVTAPWVRTDSHESRARLPHQLQTNFAGAHVAVFGDIALKNASGALRIECKSAGGIAFRWQLDPTYSTLFTITGLPKTESAREQYQVDVVPLDELLLQPGLPKIDVVKIDVEGFELEVLAGARALIAKHKPLLLIEVANELLETKQQSAANVAAELNALGYVLFDAAKGKPRLVDLMGEHSSNIFAVPEALLGQDAGAGRPEPQSADSRIEAVQRRGHTGLKCWCGAPATCGQTGKPVRLRPVCAADFDTAPLKPPCSGNGTVLTQKQAAASRSEP
jgi:FkbM family methyltransferase